MLKIVILGEMRGRGRPKFARRGKFVTTYSDAKTVTSENWIKSCAVDQVGNPCLTGPLCVWVTVQVPIRASWPKRQQKLAESGDLMPIGKPDIDNFIKQIFDAFNLVVWKDDSQVVDLQVSKRYAHAPETIVRVQAA